MKQVINKKIKKDKAKKNDKKENKVLLAISKFFNKPAPIIIVLCIICAILLIYCNKVNKQNAIYLGEINQDDIMVTNVHFFTNSDMSYYYSSSAEYFGDDKQIYNFQIGYYVVDKDGNYYELATRSDNFDKSTSLAAVVSEMSGWSFAESASQRTHFSNDVMNNLNNIHFVIKASTEKDNTSADIVIDYPVELTKITK